MEIFSTILAYGYIFVVGFVFIIMVFQILAFYIAGRLTDSIDDEVNSAFTMFGALLLIGTASTLVNAVLSTFLSGMLIPAIASFVLYIVVIIFAVVKIYELSIGKAILHMIISLVVMIGLTSLLIYAGTQLLPEGGFKINLTDEVEVGTNTDLFDDMELELELEAENVSDELVVDELTEETDEEIEVVDVMEEVEGLMLEEPVGEAMEEIVEESAPSGGPGLPGSSE